MPTVLVSDSGPNYSTVPSTAVTPRPMLTIVTRKTSDATTHPRHSQHPQTQAKRG